MESNKNRAIIIILMLAGSFISLPLPAQAFNITIYPAYGFSVNKNNNLNISIAVISLARLDSVILNFSTPPFLQLIKPTTTTETTTIISAGGGSSGRVICPPNSHFDSSNGICACDFGYAGDGEGNCVSAGFIMPLAKKTPIIPTLIAISIILGLLGFMYYNSRKEKEQERLKRKASEAKQQIKKTKEKLLL